MPRCQWRTHWQLEVEAFATLAQSDAAQSLVGLFMNDQLLKKKSKALVQAG